MSGAAAAGGLAAANPYAAAIGGIASAAGGGPSSAESGAEGMNDGRTGAKTFNFGPPPSVQAQGEYMKWATLGLLAFMLFKSLSKK